MKKKSEKDYSFITYQTKFSYTVHSGYIIWPLLTAEPFMRLTQAYSISSIVYVGIMSSKYGVYKRRTPLKLVFITKTYCNILIINHKIHPIQKGLKHVHFSN